MDDEAVIEQVERRLVAAHVRLRTREQYLRPARLVQERQERLLGAAAERDFLDGGEPRHLLRHLGDGGAESFRVLFGDEDGEIEARGRLRQREDAFDDLRAHVFGHGGHEPLLRVDDEQEAVFGLKPERVDVGHALSAFWKRETGEKAITGFSRGQGMRSKALIPLCPWDSIAQ